MRPSACLALFLFLCGCGSGGGSSDGAPQYDLSVDFQFTEIPPGCPPAAGNDRGVGTPCTREGNECNALQMQCTCKPAMGFTPPASTPCFCTTVFFNGCPTSPNCGTGASCCPLQDVQSGGIAGCLPDVCKQGGVCPVLLPSS